MRYPASEKLEIIRRVEQSHLGVGSTVDKLGIPKTTFYRCYDRFLAFGDAGLEDRNSSPGRVWNRIPDEVRGQSIDLALEETQLSPRERECPKLCVSGLAHWGFRYGQALKRSAYIIAN